MRVTNGVTVYDYSEWCKLPEVQALVLDSEECDACEGSGECTCDKCGAEHECASCNGSGLEMGDLSSLYHREMQAELNRLLKWRLSVIGEEAK